MADVAGGYTSVERVAALRGKGPFVAGKYPSDTDVEAIIVLIADEMKQPLDRNWNLSLFVDGTKAYRYLGTVNTYGAVATIIDSANAAVNSEDRQSNPLKKRYLDMLEKLSDPNLFDEDDLDAEDTPETPVTPPTPMHTFYAAIRDDGNFTAADALAPGATQDTAVALTVPDLGDGNQKRVAYYKPVSTGNYTYAYWYRPGGRNMQNQISSWEQMAGSVEINGVDYYILRSRVLLTGDTDRRVLEAG